MLRFLLLIIIATAVVLSAILLHLNPFVVILFLALGGLATSNTEFLLNYNFVDWLKDHIMSLFGFFQTYAHAKIATLRSRAASIGTKIAAEEQKISAAVKRRL